MLHNSDPFGSSEAPLNMGASVNMTLNGPMNIPNGFNMGKTSHEASQSSNPHNLASYPGYGYPVMSPHSPMHHFQNFHSNVFQTSFMGHNTPTLHDTSWQHGLLPMNLNTHADSSVNMNFYDRKDFGYEYKDQNLHAKNVPLNVPQVYTKAYHKEPTIGHSNYHTYQDPSALRPYEKTYHDNNLDLSMNKTQKPETRSYDLDLSTKTPTLDESRRRSLENTVKMIENILIHNPTSSSSHAMSQIKHADTLAPALNDNKSIYSDKAENKNIYDDRSSTKNMYAERSDPKTMYSERSDPKNMYIDSPDPKSMYNERPDPKSMYNERPDPKSMYNERPDPKSMYNERQDPKSMYNERPDPKSMYNERQDPKIMYNERPDPKNLYVERTDPKTMYIERPDPKSIYNERPDPKNMYNQRVDHKNMYNERSDPKDIYHDRSNPKDMYIERTDPKSIYNERSDPKGFYCEVSEPKNMYTEISNSSPIYKDVSSYSKNLFSESPPNKDVTNERLEIDNENTSNKILDNKNTSDEILNNKNISNETLNKKNTCNDKLKNKNACNEIEKKSTCNVIDKSTCNDTVDNKTTSDEILDNKTAGNDMSETQKNISNENKTNKEPATNDENNMNVTEPNKNYDNTNTKSIYSCSTENSIESEINSDVRNNNFTNSSENENNDSIIDECNAVQIEKVEIKIEMQSNDSDSESDDIKPLATYATKNPLEVYADESHLDNSIEVKVEELSSWADSDQCNPFQRDIFGVTRNCTVDGTIVESDVSLKVAKEMLGKELSAITYFECSGCTLFFTNPKRFLIHSKWHSLQLPIEKKNEMEVQRVMKRNMRKEARKLWKMNNEEIKDGNVTGEVFKCNSCEKMFSTRSSLKNHKQRYHPTLVRECLICHKTLVGWQAIKTHRATEHTSLSDSRYQCTDCPKRFKYSHSLVKHIDTHLEKTHGCTQCPKLFGSQKLLSTHMKTHERVMRGITCHCSYCGKGFFETYQLQVHERTHRNERPFLCQICNTSFGTNSSLQRHLKVSHSSAKPWQCATCHRNFVSEKIRDRHVLRHHGDVENFKFLCAQCPCRYLNQKDLNKHIQKNHPRPGRKKRARKTNDAE